MSDTITKLYDEFADFLQRVAGGNVRPLEWNRFIVTHYPDELLESTRQKVVRLSIHRGGGKEWSDSELEMLKHWSRELRGWDAELR